MVEGEAVEGRTIDYAGTPSTTKLLEIARFFLKIGIVGFGGPPVHIAMMEDELVGDGSRDWAEEGTFMEGLAICNMLPGPASTQLGIFVGWIRAGNPGAIVAGFFFMLPTFVIVVALSYLYFAYGTLPAKTAMFYGINPVVIGLILGASYSMAKSALAGGIEDISFEIAGDRWATDFRLLTLLVGALVATVVLNPNPVLEFVVVAGVVAVGFYEFAWVRENRNRVTLAAIGGAILGVFYLVRQRLFDAAGALIRGTELAATLGTVVAGLWANVWVKLFLFMLYTGSFIYGGGLVLIPFIEKYVVMEFAWMDSTTFVDGIAIGQLTPGPVVMTTAFVGYELLLSRGVG